MGVEQVDEQAEDDAGRAVAAGAADCIVRKFVIGPASYGGNIVRGGIAVPHAALAASRKLVGAETPEPPAVETVEP